MKFPVSEAQCKHGSEQFRRLKRSLFDGIIATLDGIAFKICQPRLNDTPDPRKYFNRKGFFAICFQAAVSADYKFVFVSARHAGSTHDSTAFHATQLHTVIMNGKMPCWARIAADDAYVNGNHILTPYSAHNLSQKQKSFKFYLSSRRITVEKAFGIPVTRFEIF